ncbi:MAG: cupin domain-containing protein [Acetobacteraceae bacterium]|nr:cupin domain-containing protein [Acetobacteraceae bacterium]
MRGGAGSTRRSRPTPSWAGGAGACRATSPCSDPGAPWPGTPTSPTVPHHTQDEFIYMLEGGLQAESGGTTHHAKPGDLIRLPEGVPHGLFNRSGAMVRCLFWVTPQARLWDLFVAIDGVADPAEVMRLAALHEIEFLPDPR